MYYRVKEHHLEHSVSHAQDPSTTIQLLSSSIAWKPLVELHTAIPSFGIKNIIDYFIFRNNSDGLEQQDWKNINSGSYKLFKEGHIHDTFAGLSHDTSFIRAKCFPEMKNDCVYEVKLQININTSNVKVAECTCPAGRGPTGSCKHLAALCFAVEDFVRT